MQVVLLSHVQLCDPMDCSRPGSSTHVILQARILEQVAMPSSRESSRPRSPILQADWATWETLILKTPAKYGTLKKKRLLKIIWCVIFQKKTIIIRKNWTLAISSLILQFSIFNILVRCRVERGQKKISITIWSSLEISSHHHMNFFCSML